MKGAAMICTDILIQEHKMILRALDVLEAMAQKALEGGLSAREDVGELLEFLNRFADSFHQGKEEDVLFPVFAAACNGAEIDAVRQLVLEHNTNAPLSKACKRPC